MCYWVLGFKVHRGPQQPQLLFSWGRNKAPDHTHKQKPYYLTTKDGVLSGHLTGSLNTSKSQVPRAGPRCQLGG